MVQHSERDGYQTADIEYLEDVMVRGRGQMQKGAGGTGGDCGG